MKILTGVDARYELTGEVSMKIFRNSLFTILVILSSVISLRAQDITITDVTTTPVSCGGGSDGTITVTVTGGTGPYTYLLVRGGVPVENAGPIPSQTYTFTGHIKYSNYIIIVSDKSKPVGNDINFATIDGPDPISITTALSTDITCNNANNGTITVEATGEQGDFVFNLTGPVNETNETGFFSGKPGGDYTVLVSDKYGCPLTDITPVLTINNPSVISIAEDNVTPVLCYGEATGAISITPSGGVPGGAGSGYTYQWTGPGGFTSGAEDITNLAAGDYFVTVYDGNLCSSNAGPMTVTQPPEITVILNNSTDVTCNGGSDGSAAVTAGGGVGGYSYLWEGQSTGLTSTSEDPANLEADTYDLTITDANGCPKSFLSLVTIDEPPPFTIAVDGTTDVNCSGGSDGSANITPGGGTPPYTYAWTGATSGYTSAVQDPVNMPADDYSLTITDSRGCNRLFASLLTIDEPSPLIFNLVGTSDVSCFGGNDGSADITLTGGTTPYLFSWTGNSTGHTSALEDPDDLPADTYSLTITDNQGCTLVFPNLLVIDEPLELDVTVDNITDVDCNGAATGAIQVTPSGGTLPYTFAWSGPNGFTGTTKDISGLEAGTYSLTLSDAKGCVMVFTDLATVAENTAITATFNISPVTCSGGSDGSINPNASGGKPSYSYSWTGPNGFTSPSKNISGLVAGPYILTVTDNLGCIQEMPPQVVTEPLPITATATHVDIDCFGAADGSVDLTPSGGTPPYSFAWTGPGGFTSNSEDISLLQPGAYSVTIIDNAGCIMAFAGIATILESPEILVSFVKNDISCGGLTDGSIDITVTGGLLPYTFAWTGPSGFTSTSEDISDLAAGSYSLTVTDGNACVVSFPGAVTIIEPVPVVATYISRVDVTCNGDATGSILINVAGGIPPYTFNWTNSSGATQSTDEDPSGLPADTYSLAVTDLNGCTSSYPDFVTITEPLPLVSSLLGTDITCYDEGDGTISVTTTGGTAPYEYSMTGAAGPYQPANLFTALAAGPHTVWTRDANLCVVSSTATLNEPDEIVIPAETVSGQLLCFGDATVQISIGGVSGGVPPYEYSINNGVDFYPSNSFPNLGAGNYQTMVRDATGCTAQGNLVVINQPLLLTIDTYSQDDIASCFGALEGRIQVAAAGGTGVLTYLLDGTISNTTGDFQNLAAGPHQLHIEDANGCTLDTSVTILSPLPIQVDNLAVTDVAGCFGDATGAVTALGSGGTGSISYALDGGPSQASGTFSGLTAGDHTLSLSDLSGCNLDTLFTIAGPLPIQILSDSVTGIICSGANDGMIGVSATGGTAPLIFTLNPGALSNGTGNFTGLAPGIYTVSVSDAAGCGPVATLPLTISDPPAIIIDSMVMTDISCNGAADGSLAMYARGGVPPLQYSADGQASWSTDSLFTGLAPGTYEAYVRDANMCVFYVGPFIMTDPPALGMSITTTDITICAGDTTGMIEVSGIGGVGSLEYSLDDVSYQSSGTFPNLSAGAYTVFLRDGSGCTISEPVNVNEPLPVDATITKTDATQGNPGSILISGASGGTPPYEFTIGGDTGIYSGDTVYTDLDTGSYHVIVRDLNGCTYEEMIEILDRILLDVVINATDVSCFGLDDGTIEIVPLNAEGPVEYSIDGGVNFGPVGLFEDLPGNATYQLAARDSVGRIFTGTVDLTVPPEIILSRNTAPAQCNAFSPTGAIGISVSGGSGSYTYLWSDGSTDEDRQNILAGTYILEITDSDLCTRIDTIRVGSVVNVNVNAGADTSVCFGESIQLQGSGSFTPSWEPSGLLTDPGIVDPFTINLTQSATFVLTISEDVSPYGCYNLDSVTVTIHPLLGIEAPGDTIITEGSSVQLQVTGGPFDAYRWEPSGGLDNSTIPDPLATPVATTRYFVFGTTEYGCEEMDSVLIRVIADIKVYNVFSPNGDGVNDYFEIEYSERFPDMLVEVYSRWGDQLYSSVGYDDSKRWDGTARGKDVPVGTYYYVIIPKSGAEPITGNVTIIR